MMITLCKIGKPRKNHECMIKEFKIKKKPIFLLGYENFLHVCTKKLLDNVNICVHGHDHNTVKFINIKITVTMGINIIM